MTRRGTPHGSRAEYCYGGPSGSRTHDLMLAGHVLSQLSYGPMVSKLNAYLGRVSGRSTPSNAAADNGCGTRKWFRPIPARGMSSGATPIVLVCSHHSLMTNCSILW